MADTLDAQSDPPRRTETASEQPVLSEKVLQGLVGLVIWGFEPDGKWEAKREAAMKLLRSLHEQLLLDPEIRSPALWEYLKHALGRIVDAKSNVSADIAFGLMRGPGRPHTPHLDRDVHITAQVILLIREGKSWEEAIGQTAQLLFPMDSGERAVQLAYKNFHSALDSFSDDDLKQLIGTTAVKPTGV